MKHFWKAVAREVAFLLVLPVVIWYQIWAHVGSPARMFPACSQFLSLLPGVSGAYLRRAFYRCVLPRCDADAWIGFGTILSHPSAEIGRTGYVGAFCSLGDVTLEDDVIVSSHGSIMNGSRQHGIDRLDIPIREQPGVWPRVTIGEGSWIGERAIVQENVGKHCIIGAGAVVTRPVPDYAVAVGVPAKVVSYRGPAQANAERAEPPSEPSQVATSTRRQ